MKYGEWTAETFQTFESQLEAWLAAYASSADTEVVERVEALLECKCLIVFAR